MMAASRTNAQPPEHTSSGCRVHLSVVIVSEAPERSMCDGACYVHQLSPWRGEVWV